MTQSRDSINDGERKGKKGGRERRSNRIDEQARKAYDYFVAKSPINRVECLTI
jgi:hypothetical protein